jgi:hypothetical protein
VKQTETSKPMPVYQLSDLDKFIPKWFIILWLFYLGHYTC